MKSNGVVVFSSDKQETVFSEDRSHILPCVFTVALIALCYLQAKVLFLGSGAKVNDLQVFSVFKTWPATNIIDNTFAV